MFSKFDEKVQKVLIGSKEEMKKLNHQYIGTEHFFLSLLLDKNLELTKKLSLMGVNYNSFKNKVIEFKGKGKKQSNYYVYTPLLKSIIEEAEVICRNENREFVSMDDLLIAFFKENEGVALRLLTSFGVDIDNLIKNYLSKKIRKSSTKKLIIEEYGLNMNKKAQSGEIDPVIGRDKEVNRVIEILCRRNKCNPLLVGPAGVGKTAIIEELSKRMVNNNVPDVLKDKVIISVSMAGLVSGTKYRGEFEERVTKMLSEIESSVDTILFIDEIHTLVGAGGADGAIDASNILKPYLARGKIKIIGATTTLEYKKSIENDRALERRFQTIMISPPNNKEVINILKKIKGLYENFHSVKISDKILESIVSLSEEYIYYRNQPDKSIDILDEVCSRTSLKESKKVVELEKIKSKINEIIKDKNQYILRNDIKKALEMKKLELEMTTIFNNQNVQNSKRKVKKQVQLNTVLDVIKDKTNINISGIPSKINEIKPKIKNILLGQADVINDLVKDIEISSVENIIRKKPKSYLFVGPPGVGKSYLAINLSKILYNSDNYIKLDMSEFSEENSITKIIGVPPGFVGYSNKHSLLDEIKERPNAMIILDNIDKAHPRILNIFLKIIDEGKITDANNELIRFDNNLILMTSNKGFNSSTVGFINKNNSKPLLRSPIEQELYNCIDKVFIFNYLNSETIKKIITKKEQEILKKLNKTSTIKITKKDLNEIIIQSNYHKYGAKKIEKLLLNRIITKITEENTKKNVNKAMETV